MTKKTETKEIKETKSKSLKVEKETKTIPAAKLPKLLKKTYTEKQLTKKIYNKIYIPEDKKALEVLFKPAGKNKKGLELFSIPEETLFTKKEISRFSALAKEIKEQKGRIRWLPLIATVVFVAAVVITLSLTKNLIAKKAIQAVCETTFEAKCDIKTIDISFFNSYFKMQGLEVANKSEPMKNLFSVEQMNFDFDMLQLLKARFVANELSITGVATNTDRTYSGDISAKKQAKIQKKKEKQATKAAKETEDSAFMKAVTEKSNLALETLTSSVKGVFDQYNPDTIIKNCYTQLQTPDVAKSTEEEIKALIAKWSAKPKEIGDSVNKVKQNVDEIAKININEIKNDPIKIKSAIESINTAYSEVTLLKKQTETISADLKKDVSSTSTLSKKLETAITHDKNLVSSELSKYSSLNLSDGKRFITGTFDNICYQVMGKYYPTVKKAIDLLKNAKNMSKEKKTKSSTKEISTPVNRAEGRMVYYKIDNTPKFWIKKAAGSGPNFSFDALDLTNDMDKTGKPVTGNVKLNFNELDHSAKLTIDTRSDSNKPLVQANYNCDKLPLSYPTSKFGDAPGVPGIETTSNLDILLNFYENDGFDITGSGKFTNMNITTVPFEPEFASKIYANTLANIKSMNLSATAGFTISGGLNLNLNSDVDKQFINALSKELTVQLADIKAKAEKELVAKLNELSGGALGEISDFNDIKTKLNGYFDVVNNMTKQLESKKAEAEKALTNAATSAIEDTKNKTKEAAASKIKGLLGQ